MTRYPGNAVDGDYVWLDVTSSQNQGTNQSTVFWTMGWAFRSPSPLDRDLDNATASVGGRQVYNNANPYNFSSNFTVRDRTFPSASGSEVFTHDGAGNLTINIAASCKPWQNPVSSFSVNIALPRIPKPPDPPTSTGVDSASGTSLRYTFSGNGNNGATITSFTAQCSTNSSFTANVQTVNANSGAPTFSGLANSTTHFFRSFATNSAGNSGFSSTLSGTTFGVPQATSSIAVDTATTSSLRYRFSANGNGGTGFTGFEAQASLSTSFTNPITLSSNGTSTFTGLEQGSTYYFRSRAFNSVGAGPYSTLNASGTGVTEGIPSAPRNLTATASTAALGRIDLSWTAPLNTFGTISGYFILLNGTQVASVSGNVTTFASTGNAAHASQSYAVRAQNTYSQSIGVFSANSNTATAVSPGVPSAPLNLTADVSIAVPGRITLNWTAPVTVGAGGITGYTIYESPNIVLGTVTGTATTFVVNNLGPGLTYTFFVRARNQIADTTGTLSVNSNTVTAQALGEPLAPTDGIAAVATTVAGRLLLAWTPPPGSQTGYNVFQVVAGQNVLLGRPAPNTFAVDGLPPGVSASFRVAARNVYTDTLTTGGAALGTVAGPLSAAFSGTPAAGSTQSVNNVTVSNSTNLDFNGSYSITALAATTFSYGRTSLPVGLTTVPTSFGSVVNTTNTELSGTYTISTPSVTALQYSRTTLNVAANTAVSDGLATNLTNPTLNGTYIVTVTDPPVRKIRYSKTLPNITERSSGGVVVNNTNTIFNGDNLIVTSATTNTLQYNRTRANVVETSASGRVLNRTNQQVFNGVFNVADVLSPTAVTYFNSDTAPALSRTNAVLNPSIEVNTTNWTTEPGASVPVRSTAQAFSGVASLRVVQATATAIIVMTTPAARTPVVPGLVYTLSAYVRNMTASSQYRIELDWFNGATSLVSSRGSDTIVPTGAWTRISVTATAPATATVVGVYVSSVLPIPASGVAVNFDAFLLEQSATLGTYFDGDTESSPARVQSWTGTPSNSSSISGALVIPDTPILTPFGAARRTNSRAKLDILYRSGWSG